MKLTLAPIPFYWPKDQIIEFYQQARSWPVDRICLGETVCSKRRELTQKDWLEIAEDLQAAGKEVAISTLALIEAESELKSLQTLCTQDSIIVEANDLSAVEFLHQNGKQFTGGPFLNIYNVDALKLMHSDGMTSWTLPVELGKDKLADMLEAIEREQLDIKTEVMVHGYLPLALSARCFTARAVERPKDACKKVCIEYPTGIPVDSQEEQRLFNLNGIQTQSGLIQDLLAEVPTLAEMGVNAIRVVPSQQDMAGIVQAYAEVLKGAVKTQAPASSAPYCNGYWFGEEGMARL